MAFRLNARYEQSGSARDFVDRERYGINPTFTIRSGSRSRLTFGFDHCYGDDVVNALDRAAHVMGAAVPVGAAREPGTTQYVNARSL